MEDAKYINRCLHKVVCEQLNIEKDSTSNLYKAVLKYPAIMIPSKVFIRSYNDERTYLYSDSTYKDVLNYSYETLSGDYSELPLSKIVSSIGITNFRFQDEKTIIFGEDPTDTSISRLIIGEDIVPQPIYLIDYSAKSDTCPICNGKNVTQDISYDGIGNVDMSSGNDKLVQTVLKSLLTPIGEQAEDISFGSSLDNLIGTEIDITSTAAMQKSIYDSLEYVMHLQDGQDLEAEERLTGINTITIEQDPDIPTKINLKVVVQDGNGNLIPCIMSLGVS